MRTLPEMFELIKSFESLHDGDPSTGLLEPKLCPTGYATYGYGRVALDKETGKPLKGKDGLKKALAQYGAIDVATARRWLKEDAQQVEIKVLKAVKVEVSDHEVSAMVSLAYNIGIGGFRTSSVLRLLNAGDKTGAAAAFAAWKKGTVNGKKVVLPGLVSRRAREAAFFLQEDVKRRKADARIRVKEKPDGMPSDLGLVSAEKPLVQSREIAAAVTTGTAGVTSAGTATAVVAEVTDTLQQTQSTLWGIDLETVQWIAIGLGVLVALGSLAGIAIRVHARMKGER